MDLLGLSYEEVREVQKGEKILDLIREAKRETFLEGKEYAVIKRKDVLNDPKNKVAVEGHKGPHGEDYHKEIYNRLEAAGARGEEKARKEGITEESKIIEQGAKEFIKELQKLSKECSTEGERLNKIITKKI